jgi:small subunit ribosomal protein S17
MEKTKQKIQRKFIGTVVSDKTTKTVTAKVETKKMHPKYKKSYKVSKKYAVHDEKEIAKIGDKIVFTDCRPISKTKKWRVLEILK